MQEPFWKESREDDPRRKISKEDSLHQEWWMPCYDTTVKIEKKFDLIDVSDEEYDFSK